MHSTTVAQQTINKAFTIFLELLEHLDWEIIDLAIDDPQEPSVELFRYPPLEYHTAICAVPRQAAKEEDGNPKP